jgi:hypothetical protein
MIGLIIQEKRRGLMNEVINIVKDFEGVIGAILGSVSTLIVTDILRKKGKLKIYLMKYEGIYYSNDSGVVRQAKGVEDSILYYSFSHKIQVYNKSEIPKIMRDFKVIFLKDKEIVYSLVPNDEATRRISGPIHHVDVMEVSNIMPKTIQVIEHSGIVKKEDFDKVNCSNRIELLYYDEKDRKKRLLLHKGVIGKSNYHPQNE